MSYFLKLFFCTKMLYFILLCVVYVIVKHNIRYRLDLAAERELQDDLKTLNSHTADSSTIDLSDKKESSKWIISKEGCGVSAFLFCYWQNMRFVLKSMPIRTARRAERRWRWADLRFLRWTALLPGFGLRIPNGQRLLQWYMKRLCILYDDFFRVFQEQGWIAKLLYLLL